MPAEQILSNAQVVTAERVFLGSVVLRDGQIVDIAEGRSQLPQAQDLGGDCLLPGLVELERVEFARNTRAFPVVPAGMVMVWLLARTLSFCPEP